MVQRMRAAQEALESEAKEEEFYLKAMVSKVRRVAGRAAPLMCEVEGGWQDNQPPDAPAA